MGTRRGEEGRWQRGTIMGLFPLPPPLDAWNRDERVRWETGSMEKLLFFFLFDVFERMFFWRGIEFMNGKNIRLETKVFSRFLLSF